MISDNSSTLIKTGSRQTSARDKSRNESKQITPLPNDCKSFEMLLTLNFGSLYARSIHKSAAAFSSCEQLIEHRIIDDARDHLLIYSQSNYNA